MLQSPVFKTLLDKRLIKNVFTEVRSTMYCNNDLISCKCFVTFYNDLEYNRIDLPFVLKFCGENNYLPSMIFYY